MGFWGWAGAIAAGWFTASLVMAAFWALLGKRIRPRPVPPRIVRRDGTPASERELMALVEIAQLDRELRGRE